MRTPLRLPRLVRALKLRSSRRLAVSATATLALVVSGLQVTPAFAVNNNPTIASAVYSGQNGTAGTYTATGGAFFAKSGVFLNLTVTTSGDAGCVSVSTSSTGNATLLGIQTGTPGSAGTPKTWTFPGVTKSPAGADGVQSVYVAISSAANNKVTACTTGGATSTPAYTVDNTGPVVGYTLSPAANTAGWTKASTDIVWSATDGGSGVSSAPAKTTVSTDGTSTKSITVADNLGNSTTQSATVKLDQVAPTITPSITGTAGSNGWYTSATTVKFTCSDALSLIASCLADGTSGDSKTITSSGTVTGTAIDNAGNTTTATSGALKVDTTAPTLTSAVAVSPNANGWYRNDVVVQWTAKDPESGIPTAPADSTITAEGSAVTASRTVTNGAGVSTTATSGAVKIDRTAPTTSVSGTSNSWTNSSSVTVTLTPNDGLSGVDFTNYSIDGGALQRGTSFALSSEGDHVISFFSTDMAGNVETANTAHVKIDRTAPTIAHAFTPLSYKDGAWTNQAVTVTFSCVDQGSGVASCSPPVTKSTEGSYTVTGTATDNAGNSATDSANVRIDTTAPVVTAKADGPANDNGWYNRDVTISYSATDALSGVASTSPAKVLVEGADQSATGSATDVAGNTGSAGVSHVNIDKTAPILTGSVSDGWHTGDVTVHWTCTDALSGVPTQPADSVVTGEGSNLSASATCTDLAGNTTTKTISGIQIDRGAPTTTADVPAANANGWYGAPVKVTLNAVDNLSGIAHTYYSVDDGDAATYSGAFSFSTEGTHAIRFWSVDVAGNVEQSGTPLTLRVDTTAPVTSITDPMVPDSGWFVTNGIPFALSATDGASGVAKIYYRIDAGDTNTYGDPFTANLSDGQHTVTYWSVDLAGNVERSQTKALAVDATAPTITGAATATPNGNGWYKQPVTVHFTCNDVTSGIKSAIVTGVAGCSPDAVVTNEGADQSVTGDAFDNAGNHSSVKVGGINLDKTAPTLTGVPATQPNANGWYNSDVTVKWQGDDGLSGIDSSTQPADTTVTGEGDSLTATSAPIQDKAGNASAPGLYGLRIDRTAPSISGGATSDPNSNHWYSAPVTVHFTCADALSGVQTCADSTTLSEGKAQSVSGSASDKAGNTASAKVSGINVDMTKPVAGYLLSEAPNAAGWYHGDVVVTWTGDDTLSGVDPSSIQAPTTITASGTDVGTGPVTVKDLAGNESDAVAVQHLKIDRLAPTISGAPTTKPNSAGWYRSSVKMHYSCTDDLSGVASCPADQVLSSDAANQSITSDTATDAAGNVTAGGYTISDISIDSTKPTLIPVVDAANAAGWYNSPVTVTWSAADALSGIDKTTRPSDVTFDTEGTGFTTGAQTVKDAAGNTSDAASVSGINIDMTGPTISAKATTDPNGAGWYNHAVTFDYTCTDPQLADGSAGSGVAGCPTSDTISGDGAGQSKPSSDATDKAGNTTPGITTPKVNIDGTAPVSTASLGCFANDGWCNGSNGSSVQVNVGAKDQENLSGVKEIRYSVNDGAEQVVAGDSATVEVPLNGSGTGTLTYWAVDNAGNAEQPNTAHLKWDTIAPAVTHTISPTPNADGWTKDDTTVTFSATDDANGSGLVASSLTAPWIQKNETAVDGLVVNGSSTDVAGNTGTDKAIVKLDHTAPTITSDLIGTQGTNGWWTTPVKAHFTCSDALSGIAKTGCPDDATMSTEGANSTTRTVDDVAGNTGSTTVSGVNIDTVAPTTGHTMSSAPNAAGWYNSPVTVMFTGIDATSGVDTTTPDVTVSQDSSTTDGTVVRGTVTDRAGNSSAESVTVKLDQAAPTITAKVTSGRMGNNGYYTGPVTVSFTCSDDLSGIPTGTCPGDQTITADGQTSVTASVSDVAGNTASNKALMVNIDQTPPTVSHTTGSYTEGGWTNKPVSVTFTGDDHRGSGIDSVTAPVTVSAQTDANGTTLSGTATDNAGNVSATDTATVKIDTTKPTISATVTSISTPNADGWYSKGVTVTFKCADALSGVASCTTPTPVTANGKTTITGTVTDAAGNTASVDVLVKVDTTAPTMGAVSVKDGGIYTLGAVPARTCAATDAGSGLSSCTVNVTGGNASGVGTFTYTATATDNVGNITTLTGTYTVKYRWDGFLQPVNDTAHQVGTSTSVFKAGSTIPMKLQLKNAAGQVVKAVTAPEWLTPKQQTTMNVPVNDTAPTATADSGSAFSYDATGPQYQYNWKTPSTSGYWYSAGVKFDDGQVYTVTIGLK
ncbi:PxKF domain-containing protein [Amnibacterium sp. CER49]|uniref:OmpL47-type beta-barrel domain-containing protein n=1 Tax=Amnibacterium sp. CER49 TaxID=3039161 RepID=UPI002446BEE5|nr:PxKF domain-containing protein [Amnibacterium sp. CER49]MDH2444366.1 PxKF domain-containing protein [Amnibacterium sp. CER49]